MQILRRVLMLALFVGVLVVGWQFAGRNGQPIVVDLIVTASPELALWQVIGLAVALGVVLAGLFGLFEITRLGLIARRYRKTVAKLESEIHQLRNLPLDADGPLAEGGGEAVPSAPERGAAALRGGGG